MNDERAMQLLGPLKCNLNLSSLGDFPVGPTVLGAQAFTRYSNGENPLFNTRAMVYPGQQQPGLQQLATLQRNDSVNKIVPCTLYIGNESYCNVKKQQRKKKKRVNLFLDEDIPIKIYLSLHFTVSFLSIVTKEEDDFI